MPKHHYQPNTTNKSNPLPKENGTTHSSPSASDATESTKRAHHSNGKFFLQRILRQGLSSWRTKRKSPTVSTPPPPPSALAADPSSPPSPPLSTGRFVTNNVDRLETLPSTASRFTSTDSTSERNSSSRPLDSKQGLLSPARSNASDSVTVDFDQPPTLNTRGYIQSPWGNNSTPSSAADGKELTSRSTPPPVNRVLSVQFTENTQSSASPPVISTADTAYHGNPLPMPFFNPSKIPPPVAPKPDVNRFTPTRSHYSNNNTPTSPWIPNTDSPTLVALPEQFTSNHFQPISDNFTSSTPPFAHVNTPTTALKEKFQSRNSPIHQTKVSSSPTPIPNGSGDKGNVNSYGSSSPSTNSSSAATPTNKHIIIQEIDTNKYEEIPAKEPDLNRQPEKSALKKLTGVKRRVIPVFRENQRPSPRPSPKFEPTVCSTPPKANGDQRSDSENDSSSDEDDEPRGTGKRFAHVQRNDSLARFLKDRPAPDELFDKHILIKPDDERKNDRETIENKLERKLSLRPKPEDLQARNILRAKTAAELIAEKEEKKRVLIRKLSFRPSIQELRDRKIIRFCDYIEVSECDDVDRRTEKTWARLTPRDKQMIRKELNEYKSSEMQIHPDSTKYTRFHPP